MSTPSRVVTDATNTHPQRRPTLIQDIQVGGAGEDAVAALAGAFLHYAEVGQGLYGFAGGGEAGGEVLEVGQWALVSNSMKYSHQSALSRSVSALSAK
jgi:hypothetical protein